MADHNPWDTPEIREQEEKERKFQQEAKEVHERVLNMPARLFMLFELRRIFQTPHAVGLYAAPVYTKADFEWLVMVEKAALSRS